MATTETERERVVERGSWRPAGIGPGMVLGILSGIGVVVSLFLEWRNPAVHADDVPLSFLWDKNASGQPSLLLVLIPCAALLIIGALIPRGGPLRLLGGLGTVVVAGLFAFQLDRSTSGSLGDALEAGFYVAALAGILGVVSGVLPGGWAWQRTVEREDPGAAGAEMWDRRRR
jgi:hypothetical protein